MDNKKDIFSPKETRRTLIRKYYFYKLDTNSQNNHKTNDAGVPVQGLLCCSNTCMWRLCR